jgi:hypothetical protein
MRLLFSPAAWAAAVLVAVASAAAHADSYAPRQYYGAIRKHPSYSYSYRAYYYKPTPTYVGYRHHYVIYVSAQPKYVYFYNPYKRQYWGRCPVASDGKGQYSLLAEKDRKASLDAIDESAFPPPGDPPPVPESTDGASLELPPDDLPSEVALPGGK